MRLRAFRALTVRRSGFVAISALATVVVLAIAAQPASAATALSGEALTGAGPSTGGSTNGNCNMNRLGGSMDFSISGTASGPYPGSFAETGSFSYTSTLGQDPGSVGFKAKFTITSGATTIKGSVANQSSLGSAYPICNSAGQLLGFSVSGLPITYTTIHGHAQGTGSLSGTFYTTAGAQDSLSESLT
jgi:hypothetical protein